MKEDEIQRMTAETLEIASQVAPVPVPLGLKGRIMRGIAPAHRPASRLPWLRPALSVAAAVLVLAVNLVTIRHFVTTRSTSDSLAEPLDEIHAEYSQYNADF